MEFIKKYNNHEYISNDLYLNVLANYSGAVPSNFNIDTYNDIVLEKLYLLNKDYFDNFYKDIVLKIKDKNELKSVFNCLFTPNERRDFAERWQVVKELKAGTTQREIARKYNMSLCKITRGSKELQKSGSGFLRLLELLKD